MSTVLYHHGVKGMRWGVRRYQNKDGTLTKRGQDRLRRIYNQSKKSLQEEYDDQWHAKARSKAGITDHETYSVLAKGSTAYRVSNTDTESMDRPKYVAVTEEDVSEYKFYAQAAMLGFEKYENLYLYEMVAKKDVRIAQGKEIVDYILENSGDKINLPVAKEYVNAERTMRGISELGYFNYHGTSKSDALFAKTVLSDGRRAYQRLLHNSLVTDTDFRDKIFDEFRKRGYDAIEDVEDSMYLTNRGRQSPTIILNPDKAFKLKSVNKL